MMFSACWAPEVTRIWCAVVGTPAAVYRAAMASRSGPMPSASYPNPGSSAGSSVRAEAKARCTTSPLAGRDA